MRSLTNFLRVAVLVVFWSGASSAQPYLNGQERAIYAGAYLSLSFGGGHTPHKQPIRYGFSAGFRQSNFGQSRNYFSPQFDRFEANLDMLDSRDWQARVVDMNFSDRGFERLSVSGTAFVQKDAFGRLYYFGNKNRLDGDGSEEGKKDYGYDWGDILLWGGAAIGVIGIISFSKFSSEF